MRRRGIAKTAGITLAVIFAVNSIAGCGGRNVDYGVVESTEWTGRGSGGNGKGLEQFADASVWADEWTAVNSKGNEVTVQVNADVVLPDAKQMSVVEAREVEINAAFKERVAKGVFGGGSIYYYDGAHRPKKDLIESLEEEKSQYDAYASDKTIEDSEMRESLEWSSENIEAYEELIEKAKETYTSAERFDVDQYLGERGGKFYELSFWDYKFDTGEMIRNFVLEKKNIRQRVSADEAGFVGAMSLPCYPYGGYNMVDNRCEMSVKEARELADDFVEEVGLDYTVYAYYLPLVWGSSQDEANRKEDCDGYVFYYDAGIDDVSFVMPGTAWDYQQFYKKEGTEQRYSMNARMEIYVNEDGILYVEAHHPIEFTGVLEDVSLLALEDIQNIIKEKVIKDFGSFRFIYTSEDRQVEFNKMELIYFRVKDEENEGSYSYVPTWRLGQISSGGDMGNKNSIYNCILVNAIDGSVINFYNEI